MSSGKTIILAIDGGGIRGIIPAYILNQIEQTLNKRCFQLFDIIGGTSTGAIITAALTTPDPSDVTYHYPFSAESILNIYSNDGGQIFYPQSNWIDLKATYTANEDGQGIEPFLQNNLGATTSLTDAQQAIAALPGSRVKQMFTTGCIVNSTGGVISNPVPGTDVGAYLFNWMDAASDPCNNYYVWEAARSSSAAPSYFPVAHVGGGSDDRSAALEKWVVDGGVMSNNPAMWSLAQAFWAGMAQSLSDIVLISLGTGIYPGGGGVGITNNTGVSPADGNWSLIPWMLFKMYDLQGKENDGTLVNIILDAVQNVAAQQLSLLTAAGLTYYRLEPVIPYSLSQMDNITPENIANLYNAAEDYIGTGGAGNALYNEVLTAIS